MRVAFSETLSGGVHARVPGPGVQAVRLDLDAIARGIVEGVLGAPLSLRGALHAEPPTTPEAAFLPREAVVFGTLRFIATAGLFYDLRVAAREGDAARDQLVLRGARRFVRGDLLASSTLFEGVLVVRGAEAADVRLRFDARDDIPRFFRSLRRV